MSIPSEDLSPRDEDVSAALLGFFPLVIASFTGYPGTTSEGPENDFDAQVRATHKVLRSHDLLLKSLVRWGNEDPVGLALWGVRDIKKQACLWHTVAETASGVDLADLADRGWPSPGRGSYTLADMILLPWAAYQSTLFRWAERRMERLVEVFAEKAKSSEPMSGEDFAGLLGAIYIDAVEQEPYIAARALDKLRKGCPDHFSGQVLAELLGGYSVAHISLWKNRRLGKAIDARLQDGETRFEYLLKKAPWTALDAWEDEEEPPDLWSLRTKVARLLEKPGVPDIVGDFERQEAARQAITELAERAALSEGERRVFELDMLADHDTKAIARELDRSPSTVRGWRKRYRDKMSQASTS